ncbi:sensor histidine kinase, partial [Burkholderia cenocepacia]|nr:sensor histidine kinase [Burkholderia cenocepacia]
QFLVQIEFKMRTTGMDTLVTHDEAVWNSRATDPARVAALAAGRGRLIIQGSPAFPPTLVLADLSPAHPADSYAHDLAMASDMSYRVGAYVAKHDADRAIAGYAYRPDRSFAVVIPEPVPPDPLTASPATDAATLVARVAAG